MKFKSVNNLKTFKLYFDNRARTYTDESGNERSYYKIYFYFEYFDLDNNLHNYLYSTEFNKISRESLDDNRLKLITFLTLIYNMLDYFDHRNKLYEALYKANIELFRRGYYFLTMKDYNYGIEYVNNLKIFEKSSFINNKGLILFNQSPSMLDSQTYYGYDENGNIEPIPSENLEYILGFSFDYENSTIIYDKFRYFVQTQIQTESNPVRIRDFKSTYRYTTIVIYLNDVTVDNLDQIKNKVSSYEKLYYNLYIMKNIDEIKQDNNLINKILELSDLFNLHIFIQIDVDNSNKELSVVKTEIEDIETTFGSRIDGIVLKNIKRLSDNPTTEERNSREEYYTEIIKFAHNDIFTETHAKNISGENITIKNRARYYVAGLPENYTSGDLASYEFFYKYNPCCDTVLHYYGDAPSEVQTFQDTFLTTIDAKEKTILLTNKTFNDPIDESDINYIKHLNSYCYGIGVTSNANFNTLDIDSIEKLSSIVNSYIDEQDRLPISVNHFEPNN